MATFNIVPEHNKVFLSRDYTNGTACRFNMELPTELRNNVSESQFKDTVKHINDIFAEAERLSCRSYMEGCLGCLTAYTIFLCVRTHYEKCVDRVALYIVQQNKDVYEPLGVKICDPMERGLRCIEIQYCI
ncbi:Golgin subfamily A member 7 [Oopsacas minuta]|uniref:Ras modification protein ERF4 n=1 Tax=Oopsacas minuta TaxID=111878 RepID=A0AAV7KCZ6_9METZ|nr:Golgin subfamily A member 7 [Oopsacas minuta]